MTFMSMAAYINLAMWDKTNRIRTIKENGNLYNLEQIDEGLKTFATDAKKYGARNIAQDSEDTTYIFSTNVTYTYTDDIRKAVDSFESLEQKKRYHTKSN